MKITSVEAIVLRLPDITTVADGSQDTCLIRIDTDAGVTGWGEVDSAPTVVRAAIEAPLSNAITCGVAIALEGADPLAIDACMQRVYDLTQYYTRYGVGAHAVAGVNNALWDLAGKAYGQPVYRLFGAARHRVRAYASVLFQNTPSETHDLAARLAARGFTAMKFGWGPMGQSEASDIAHVREARRGAGDNVDLMIDAGQPWDWRTALRRTRQFAEYRPFWLEEPLHPEDIAGYSKLTAVSEIPIAGAESESRLVDFEQLIVVGGLDWVQADPGRCGISTMVEIGRLAARHQRGFVNHTFKTGVSIAASLHVLAAVPNTQVLEYGMSESPLRHELTYENFELDGGWVAPSDAPGLGVTINEETIERYALR